MLSDAGCYYLMLAPEFKQNTDYGQPEIVFETHLNLLQQTHDGQNIFSSVDEG